MRDDGDVVEARPEDESSAGRTRYAAGLPQVRARALEPREIAELRRRWRRQRSSFALALVGLTVFVVGTASAMAAFAPTWTARFGGAVGCGIAAGGIAGVALALAKTRGWWRRGIAMALGFTVTATALGLWLSDVDTSVAAPLATPWLRTPWVAIVLGGCGAVAVEIWQRTRVLVRARAIASDLVRAELAVFEGNAHAGEHTWRRLLPLGLHRSARHVRIDVLPGADVAVAVDGRWLTRWERVHSIEIAAARPHAFRTALPSGLLRVRAPSRVAVARRSLSTDERAEIDAHIRQLRRSAWPALAASIATVAVLGTRFSLDPRWQTLIDAVAIGWYLLAAVAIVSYVRRMAAARKLELDRDLRWVVTLEHTPARADTSAPCVEVLPISHLAWTEDAAPAPWRMCRL